MLLGESIRGFDVGTHRRLGSSHSLPEYVLQDEDLFAPTPHDYMVDAYEKKGDTALFSSDDEVPCCSSRLPSFQVIWLLDKAVGWKHVIH